jgi:hypothetical protein
MSVLNSEHIEKILTEIEAMQEEKVELESSEDGNKGTGGIISRVKEFNKEGNTMGDR